MCSRDLSDNVAITCTHHISHPCPYPCYIYIKTRGSGYTITLMERSPKFLNNLHATISNDDIIGSYIKHFTLYIGIVMEQGLSPAGLLANMTIVHAFALNAIAIVGHHACDTALSKALYIII